MASSEKPNLKLYSYWRSSCAWRVRIALNFKGLEYEYKAVDLLKGEHHSPDSMDIISFLLNKLSTYLINPLGGKTQESKRTEFQKLNPLGYVPALVDGDVLVADSFAIIMYLEEKYPQHPLLPQDLQKKALNYQVANIVASNIQPLQNLAVLNYIEEKLGADEKFLWAQHHVKKGFGALEKLLKGHGGKYATGDEVALADVFLAPQIAAFKRFNIDMAEFPLLNKLNEAYSELPAFQNALPEKQPDAPDDVKF